MLAPKLRFKEFNDEWKKVKINKILKIKHGKNQKEIECINGKYPILGTGGIIGTTNTPAYLKESVLIGRKGTIDKPMYINIPFWTVDTLFYSDVSSNYNVKFIYYLFNTINWKKYDESTGVPSLSANTIENIDVNISLEKEEQLKISQFLSLFDKKIELQQRKIEVLKMYKRGLINQLYTSLDCSEVQIKDIGEVITGTTPSKDNLSYWSNGTIVWVTPSDITEFKNISDSQIHLTPQGLNAGRKLPKNTLLITCIASIGKNAILKVDGSCNQQINAIIPCNDYDIDFLYYLFEYKKSYMQSIAGTSATSIINKSSFEKILLKIPKISVQKKIAKNLSAIDYKIEVQQHLLDGLFTFKKSLLQQMFI